MQPECIECGTILEEDEEDICGDCLAEEEEAAYE